MPDHAPYRRFAMAAAVTVATTLSVSMSGSPSAAQTPADDAAWAKLTGAGSLAAYRDYLKEFPQGAHREEAQMQIVDLTLAAPTVKSDKFDGTWQTTVSCPSVGQQTRGFTFQFAAPVNGGDYHGGKGVKGERGWYTLDGRIDPDGFGAMRANGIIGASAFAVGNAPAGNAYAYHVIAQFGGKNGSGKRIEGRVCNLTFLKE